jgi:hypothetical protein
LKKVAKHTGAPTSPKDDRFRWQTPTKYSQNNFSLPLPTTSGWQIFSQFHAPKQVENGPPGLLESRQADANLSKKLEKNNPFFFFSTLESSFF